MARLPRTTKYFANRLSAGLTLSSDIEKLAEPAAIVVVGLARGGIPVAYSIAQRLSAPLEVLVARKLGVPWQEELAFGAIAPDGICVLNPDIILGTLLNEKDIAEVEKREREELERRQRAYRGNRPEFPVSGKTVILVDDGLATGATMQAALEWARKNGARRCIAAAPVGSRAACEMIEKKYPFAKCVCHLTPDPFYSVGSWYDEFSQVTDEAVSALLEKRRTEFEQNAKEAAPHGSPGASRRTA